MLSAPEIALININLNSLTVVREINFKKSDRFWDYSVISKDLVYYLNVFNVQLSHLSICGLNRRKIFYVFVTKLFSWVFRRVFLFSIRFNDLMMTSVAKWLQAGLFYFWQYLMKSIMTKVLFWHRSQRFYFDKMIVN